MADLTFLYSKYLKMSFNKDIFTRLRNGETIMPDDPEIHKLLQASYEVKKKLNLLNTYTEPGEILKILSEIVGEELENVTVFTPIYINYGKHLNIGKNVFINFDCTFLTLGGITIEDDVLIGPKVSLITENHPLTPQHRKGLIGKSIHIKKNAWIGASATILPGVTIGENAVVAAGAVVSKDVPDNVLAGGIPAKIIKTIE
ncbi:Putative acetyltransferase SACOL2570 [Chryseobacterium gleum]|uniref:Acetyltransferase SACOL2570 n=3 Tax=Chryseobacterium gleum TaxID=250 RepID=A0A3S4NTJ5_CHRGE|nr:bacterial transferase hexapeptide repeat protein [Chryseobacterium gleum ATCC 35910]VEE06590.1 Putative acetyltransferase SACOL2570 [Chryseobacterium gleum]